MAVWITSAVVVVAFAIVAVLAVRIRSRQRYGTLPRRCYRVCHQSARTRTFRLR